MGKLHALITLFNPKPFIPKSPVFAPVFTCNYCKNPGHYIAECPVRPPRPQAAVAPSIPAPAPIVTIPQTPYVPRPPIICYRCGYPGHISRECPNLPTPVAPVTIAPVTIAPVTIAPVTIAPVAVPPVAVAAIPEPVVKVSAKESKTYQSTVDPVRMKSSAELSHALVVKGMLGDIPCTRLVIDPGSSFSMIDVRTARKGPIPIFRDSKLTLQLANGECSRPIGETVSRQRISVEGVVARLRMPVVDSQDAYDVLLSRDWLHTVDAVTHFGMSQYTISRKDKTAVLQGQIYSQKDVEVEVKEEKVVEPIVTNVLDAPDKTIEVEESLEAIESNLPVEAELPVESREGTALVEVDLPVELFAEEVGEVEESTEVIVANAPVEVEPPVEFLEGSALVEVDLPIESNLPVEVDLPVESNLPVEADPPVELREENALVEWTTETNLPDESFELRAPGEPFEEDAPVELPEESALVVWAAEGVEGWNVESSVPDEPFEANAPDEFFESSVPIEQAVEIGGRHASCVPNDGDAGCGVERLTENERSRNGGMTRGGDEIEVMKSGGPYRRLGSYDDDDPPPGDRRDGVTRVKGDGSTFETEIPRSRHAGGDVESKPQDGETCVIKKPSRQVEEGVPQDGETCVIKKPSNRVERRVCRMDKPA